jgi:hypothetical protein
MDERELKLRLDNAAEVAAGQAARGDLADVELRAGRVRTRRRGAMLVAGAGGAGFGLGRSVDGQPDGEAIAPAATAAPDANVAPSVIAPDATTAPTTAPTTEAATAATTAQATDAPAATVAIPPGVVTGVAEDAATSVYAPYAPQPMTLLGSRQLADGTRVRVQLGQPWDMGDMGYPGGFQPAAWCNANQEVRVTVDGPDLVDVTGMAAYVDLSGAPVDLIGQRSEFGYADGRSLRVLLVQSAAGDTAATVRWDDGATDTADFIDGIVVLVADGSNAWEHTYEVDVTGPARTRTVAGTDVEDVYSLPEWRVACQPPPPPLPEPGEQPSDPAAAEAALRADFAALWDRAIPREDKQHLLDDWTGVGEAIDAVDTGIFADAAASAVHTIDELSFTSATEVWFRYSITTDVSDFYDRYGRATLVDGSWQFPRGMMCQDLQLASATCTPPEAPIYPPSWFEVNGSAWYGGCDTEGNCVDCQVFGDGREECTEYTSEMPPVVGEVAPATTAPAGP